MRGGGLGGGGGLGLRENAEIKQQYLQRQREQQEYMKVQNYVYL